MFVSLRTASATMQRVTLEPNQIHENCIHLTDSQIHYLRRVLRLGEGDRFIALDGQGQGWVAGLGQERAVADIVQPWQCNTELLTPIHLLIAMPKMGMDDIVRQATELGVSSIVPVVSDRTLLNPSVKKVDRWRRIAQEAIEQCERQWVPAIAKPMRFWDALVEIAPSNSPTSYGHPRVLQWICVARSDKGGERPQHLLGAMLKALTNGRAMPNSSPNPPEPIGAIVIAVGPEGGWTPSEVEQAIALGYAPISLGPRILRAVTAPLGAIAIIAAILDQQTEDTSNS